MSESLTKGVPRKRSRRPQAERPVLRLPVPGNFDRDVVDFAEVFPDEEGFAMARRAIREEGLLIGGSAGTNLAAAIRVAMRDDLDGPVVTVGCDSWDRYRSCKWMRS